MGFAENFIEGYTRGHEIRRSKEELSAAQDERKLRTQVLRHQIDRLKIEDALHAREIEQQNAAAMNGMISESDLTPDQTQGGVLPARSLASVVHGLFNPQQGQGQAPGSAMFQPPTPAAAPAPGFVGPVQPVAAPVTSTSLPDVQAPVRMAPAQIRGIPAIGDTPAVPGYAQPLQTREEVSKARTIAALQDAMNKTYTVAPGSEVVIPSLGTIAKGGPKPRTFQAVNRLVNGKPASVNYDPSTGAYTDQSGQAIAGTIAPIPTRAPAAAGAAGGSASSDVKEVARAIMAGEQSPELTGLYRNTMAVRAELGRQGYNHANALTDWRATQRHFATMNGPAQTRMVQAIDNASHSLDVIDDLSSKWKGGRFPVLNRANLMLAKNGAYGPDVASVANQLDAQISDVTAELGQVYMGGNSPTDHALGLASKNLSTDWSDKVLKDMTQLARQNLRIRQNSIANTKVIAATDDNTYGGGPTGPSGATAPVNPFRK